MKKRTVKLSVADPCHEDWNAMNPQEQGRFCSVCSKVVVDFSKMSDQEVLSLIDTSKKGDTCGQFTQNQLEKTFYYPVEETSKFSLRAVLLGATLTSVLGLESCKTDKHVVGKMAIQQSGFGFVADDTIQKTHMTRGEVAASYNHNGEKMMSGTITDSDSKNVVQNANISLFSLNGEKITDVKSDKLGKFELKLDWSKSPNYVTISSNGYEQNTIRLEDCSSITKLEIILANKRLIMGKVLKD